jgi:hypothetical protein
MRMLGRLRVGHGGERVSRGHWIRLAVWVVVVLAVVVSRVKLRVGVNIRVAYRLRTGNEVV